MTDSSRRHFLHRGAVAMAAAATQTPGGLARAAVSRSPRRQARANFRLGVNIAGAEFKAIGGRWKWPKLDNLAYYLDKGFTVFRIPFKWARLQPELQGPLDEAALQGLDQLVAIINRRGAVAILDSHDYGRRAKSIIADVGSPVTADDFADFWGRMAVRYKVRPLVWYNLMNEPHDQPAKANLSAQNAACRAIRNAGAPGKVLFSGRAWTGAHSWIKSGNGRDMLAAHDPAGNYAFDVHQYLDPGFGGSRKEAIPGIGSHVLDKIVDWARTHDKKLFVGEFGTIPTKPSLIELDALLGQMVANSDVFIGATYFAGGGTWGSNPGSPDPVNGVEKPQTLLLEKYLRG